MYMYVQHDKELRRVSLQAVGVRLACNNMGDEAPHSEMGDEALEPGAMADWSSRAFRDALAMHLVMMMLFGLSFGYMSGLPCYGEGKEGPFVLATVLCALAILARLSLHVRKDWKVARKIALIGWFGAMVLQSISGIYWSLHRPAYGKCQALWEHTLHFYHMIGMPVYCLVGMLHGSFAMPVRRSVLTGLPFVIKAVSTHVRHLYPFAWRQPDEAQRELEAKVVIAGGIAVVVSWLTGLFIAHALDNSRRRLLEQQLVVQALQAARVEQLECEKQRIQYDLVFTQRELSRGQSELAMHGLPEGGGEAADGEDGRDHGGSWRQTVDGGSTSDAPSWGWAPIADSQHSRASSAGSCSEIGDVLEAIPDHGESSVPGGPRLSPHHAAGEHESKKAR
jgi:hypothetical protein